MLRFCVRPAVSVLLTFAMLSGAGCHWVRPYRIDLRQGSSITGEMVARLKPGMTPDQVRFILGTSLLADPFHAERWDYPYEFRAGRSSVTDRQLFSVYFKDGKLLRWEGDVKPASGNEAGQNRIVEISAPH